MPVFETIGHFAHPFSIFMIEKLIIYIRVAKKVGNLATTLLLQICMGTRNLQPIYGGKENFSNLFVFLLIGERIVANNKLEREFQSSLIKDLKNRFPGCIVLKNDSSYIQGIPDLTVFYEDKWATLECKRCANASHRPNQDYYVGRMNEMSFSRFISPENKEDVLNELQQSFQS